MMSMTSGGCFAAGALLLLSLSVCLAAVALFTMMTVGVTGLRRLLPGGALVKDAGS